MSSSETPARQTTSPDPASHATNIYDTTGTESEWIDEADDDDMNTDLVTEDSEDGEFFDPAENDEGEYHGVCYSKITLFYRLILCSQTLRTI